MSDNAVTAPAHSSAARSPRLEVRNVSKTFAGRTVLSGINLVVEPGQLHGVVGQNGSGKSTLAKVITGYHAPDAGGSVWVDGTELRLPIRPRDLRAAQVSIVHQDLGLVDDMSVVENVRIASLRAQRWSRRIDWQQEAAPARLALDRLGYTGSLRTQVRDLSPADRARVAIGRAIQDHTPGSGLIIFDESTRSLPSDALADFYATVRQLVQDGTGAVMIGHRLDEILEHCDRVSILRDGRCEAQGLPTSGVSEADLARLMLGHSLERLTLSERADRTTLPVVSVRNLEGDGIAQPLDLDFRPGEILGVTGMPGSGFEALPYLLSGALPARGSLSVAGKQVQMRSATIERLVKAGVVLVPENRPREGLGLAATVEDNVALPWLATFGRWWWIGSSRVRKEAEHVIRTLGVHPPDRRAQVASLSGGNQQKVLLGKWLVSAPTLLLLHEPTQAVDVKARQDLLRAIHGVAQGGTAILLASTEPEDLISVCDRVLIFRNGSEVAELSTPFTAAQIFDAVYSAPAPTVTDDNRLGGTQ